MLLSHMPFMLSVVMRNVVMLSVVALLIIMDFPVIIRIPSLGLFFLELQWLLSY
jgi:hypothetical protein